VKRLILILVLAVLAGCTGDAPFVGRQFQPLLKGPVHAVCYGPHRDGQRPGGPGPSAAELREDLSLMQAHWRLLRIYSAGGVAETLLEEIRTGGLEMKVVLGVWIAPEVADANRTEVDTAIRLANTYPGIVAAVCVGNETQIDWSVHRSPVADLIEHVRRVRGKVTVPVTVADDFNYWNKPESRVLAAELDFILMHAHPLWNGLPLDGALAWLQTQLAEVEALHPGRPVVVGETGWATSVHTEGEQAKLIKGQAGEAEQTTFHAAVRTWTEQDKLTVFFFEAFDEAWKGGDHPAEVEKHWGLYNTDRSPKAAVAGSGTD